MSEIAKIDADAPISGYEGFTAREIDVIKTTCVPTLTRAQDIVAFCKIAKLYQLDPFSKEIWGWEMAGRVSIEASASGWRKIIRRQPNFKRMVIEPWYQTDEIEFDLLNGRVVRHTQKEIPKGLPVGAYCFVQYHDGSTNLARALWSEYGKTSAVWKYAQEMIKAKAAAIFGRTYCGVSGIYAEGEIDKEAVVLNENHEQDKIECGKSAKQLLREKQ